MRAGTALVTKVAFLCNRIDHLNDAKGASDCASFTTNTFLLVQLLGVEITPPESIYPDFYYRATDPNGIVENEVCPVFAARTTSALQINDDEVMDYQWCDLADVLHGIDATPWAFSPWMVMQAANSEARKLLSAFAQHN